MCVTKRSSLSLKSVPHALVTLLLARLSQPRVVVFFFFPLKPPLDTLLQLGLGVKK